jgi:hypothetical protein
MRTTIITTVILAGLLALASTAGAYGQTRYCGQVPRMISNEVHATRNVGCREARHLMKATLGGSRACYPNGFAMRVNCYVDGYHCRSWYHPYYGTSTGRCTTGRRLVLGYAGP